MGTRITSVLLSFKALNGLAPSYLTDILTPYVSGPPLRLVDAALLAVPRSWHVTKGDQALGVIAQGLWKILPTEIGQAESLAPLNPP